MPRAPQLAATYIWHSIRTGPTLQAGRREYLHSVADMAVSTIRSPGEVASHEARCDWLVEGFGLARGIRRGRAAWLGLRGRWHAFRGTKNHAAGHKPGTAGGRLTRPVHSGDLRTIAVEPRARGQG